MNSTSGRVASGGETDEESRYIAPTLIEDVSTDDKIMQEEIFGPLLPFVTVENMDKAVEFVNEREKPLAFYVFTESKQTFLKINRLTSAGAVVHNDTLMHASIRSLPFGGVGYSGCGAYHGKFSFDTFTHYKSTLSCGTGLEGLNKLRYPPLQEEAASIRWLFDISEKGVLPRKLFLLFMVVAFTAVLVQVFGMPGWVYRFLGK